MRTTLSCEKVDVSPSLASEMLDSNRRNRPLRRRYVRQLAHAMLRGEWMLNGEPVQLAEDGTVLNGQHRLSAVVESGMTVPMLVIRNVPVKAQRTMDTGARRNLSDVLKLHGESHTTNLAAALALLHRYRSNARMESQSHTAPTARQALDLLQKEPELRDGVQLAGRVYRDTHMRISIAIVLCHLFNEADAGAGTAFFEETCRIKRRPLGDPVKELLEALDRSHSDLTYGMTTYVQTALTIEAFNAWMARRSVQGLHFRTGDRFPQILA